MAFNIDTVDDGKYDFLKPNGGDCPLLHEERINLIYAMVHTARCAVNVGHPDSATSRTTATQWCEDNMLNKLWDALEDSERDLPPGLSSFSRIQEILELQASLLEAMLALGDSSICGNLDLDRLPKMLVRFHEEKFLGSLCRYTDSGFLSRDRSAVYLWNLAQRVGDLCLALILQYLLDTKLETHPIVEGELRYTAVHAKLVSWSVFVDGRPRFHKNGTIDDEVSALVDEHCKHQMTMVVLFWAALLSSIPTTCRAMDLTVSSLMQGKTFKNTPILARAIEAFVNRALLEDSHERDHSVMRIIMKGFVGLISSVFDIHAFPEAPTALATLLRMCLCQEELALEFWTKDYAQRSGCSVLLEDLFGNHPSTFAPFIELLSSAAKGNDAVFASSMGLLTKPLQVIRVPWKQALDCIAERRGVFELRQEIYAEELFLRACGIHIPDALLDTCTTLPKSTPVTVEDEVCFIPTHRMHMLHLVGLAWESILHAHRSANPKSAATPVQADLAKSSKSALSPSVLNIFHQLIHLITALCRKWEELENALPGRLIERLVASFFLLHDAEADSAKAEVLNALVCCSDGYARILHALCSSCHGQDFVQALWHMSSTDKNHSNYTCTIASLRLIEQLFSVCPIALWTQPHSHAQSTPLWTSLLCNSLTPPALPCSSALGSSPLCSSALPRHCEASRTLGRPLSTSWSTLSNAFVRFSLSALAHHLMWPMQDAQRLEMSRICIRIASKVVDCLNQPMVQQISETGMVPALLRFVYCERANNGENTVFQNVWKATVFECEKKDGALRSKPISHNKEWTDIIGDALDCIGKLMSVIRSELSPQVSALAAHLLERTILPATAPQTDFVKSLFAYTCSGDDVLAEKAAKVLTSTMVFWASQQRAVSLSNFLSYDHNDERLFVAHFIRHALSEISSSKVSLRIAFCDLLAVGAELHPFVFVPDAEKIVETCFTVLESVIATPMDEDALQESNFAHLLCSIMHVLLAIAQSTRLKKGEYKWQTLCCLCNDFLAPHIARGSSCAMHLVMIARTLANLASLALDLRTDGLLPLVETLLTTSWFAVPHSAPAWFVSPDLKSIFLPSKEDRKLTDFFRSFLLTHRLQPEVLTEPAHVSDGQATKEAVPKWLLRSLSHDGAYGRSFYVRQSTIKVVTSSLASACAANQVLPKDFANLEPFAELSLRRSFWDAVELFLDQFEALLVSALGYALSEDSADRSTSSASFLQCVAPLIQQLVPFVLQLMELHNLVTDHAGIFCRFLRLITRLLVFPPFLQPGHAPRLTGSSGKLPSGTPIKMPPETLEQLRMLYGGDSAGLRLIRHLALCFQTSARAITEFPSPFVDVCVNVSSLLLTLLPSVAKSARGFEVPPILFDILATITNLLSLHDSATAKRAKKSIDAHRESEACGFATLCCTVAATVVELLERQGTHAVDSLTIAVLSTIAPALSPGANLPQSLLDDVLHPSADSVGWTLQGAWCRRLDSVLQVLQAIGSTTQGALVLIEHGIFEYLKHSQLLRWGAMGNAAAYITLTNRCWRRPLHTTWCHCLILVAKLLQQAPSAAQPAVLDFFETFQARFTYLLECGAHSGEMALHEECTATAKILGLLPQHSILTRRLLFSVAKAFSVMTSTMCGPLDVRPYWILRTTLEKRSANVRLNDDVSCAACVPSVFHQRAQYLAFDTFRSNVQGLLQLALSDQGLLTAEGLWPVVMDNVLEGGRRVCEFLEELVQNKQCMFIRVQDERNLYSTILDTEVLPLSMYLVPIAPDKTPDAPRTSLVPTWTALPEIGDGEVFARMEVLPLSSDPLGIEPESTTIEGFVQLCAVTLEMASALLFHFCTNGGNSVAVLHGFLNFLHEFRVSQIYNSTLLSMSTREFFDRIDESLRTSLNLGTSDAIAVPTLASPTK